MGFLTRTLTAFDDPATGQNLGGGFFGRLVGFGGVTVANNRSALTLSAFYNAVDTISSDVAMLPKAVFKKDGKKRIEYKEHPVNYLISTEPNAMMTAFDFWKAVRYYQLIKGNAVVRIVRNGSTGHIERFMFCENIGFYEKDDKMYYRVGGETLSGHDVLHFKGFSLDGGKTGVGVITFAAAQLGVQLSTQKYAGEVYDNKGLTYGIITSKNAITKKDIRDAVKAGVKKDFGDIGKNKVAILDDDMQYQPIAVTPEEAQFLESHKEGNLEVCRWLNIAPHKLKILDNANYSNIYQQSTEHVQYTLMRWVIADEQECNRKLFSEAERGTVYVKWNINFLLRGDLDMKQRWYSSMIYAGVFNRNEVRALEDMNPVDGLDDYLQPTNMQTLEAMMENLKLLQAETQNTNNDE